MKKMITIASCLLFVLTISVLQAQEQNYVANVSKTGTSAANFLRIGIGARALAMGGAFVAVADDPTAAYWNVAGLAAEVRGG